MNELKAQVVAIQNDDDMLLVGFADHEYETNDYITLQRALNPTAQDKALSQDGIYIEINDQIRSYYGGINCIILSKDSVSLQLSSEAATEVQSDVNIKVDISLQTCANKLAWMTSKRKSA